MQVSTGRLIVPMYAGAPPGSSICFSDDHGETWDHSDQLLGGVLATEGEITELFSPKTVTTGKPTNSAAPTLYYTIRNDRPHLPRQYATSTDLGITWSNLSALYDVRDPGMYIHVCHALVTSFASFISPSHSMFIRCRSEQTAKVVLRGGSRAERWFLVTPTAAVAASIRLYGFRRITAEVSLSRSSSILHQGTRRLRWSAGTAETQLLYCMSRAGAV